MLMIMIRWLNPEWSHWYLNAGMEAIMAKL